MDWVSRQSVYAVCDESGCYKATGKVPINAGCVDAKTGDSERARCRWRLVAKDVKRAKRPSEYLIASELFSGAPPLESVSEVFEAG
eukprot:1489054-Pyramimonas_sp.AAC.1